jgi:CRISPR-associated protein Cmr6
MSGLPLPERLRELLALGAPGNRSLLFDKGMDRYDGSWRIGAGEKESFLIAFADAFRNGGAEHFESFLTRRREAMGVEPITLTTQTRLVIGLGLPSPLETGFLFDWLVGCPYLPGSSVKGLLRATARLVQRRDLQGNQAFWSQQFDRVFGPELTPQAKARTGEVIAYDAFPATWPVLEVDVLTPHYGQYYREEIAPGDWDNPVPVPFLTLAAGTPFHFYLRANQEDSTELRTLLGTGLDWLGIGAKKSSGYGVFADAVPEATPSSPFRSPQPNERPPKKTATPSAPLPWVNVELSLREGSVVARKGEKLTAKCRGDEVERKLLDELKRSRVLRADVEVFRLQGNEYRLVAIKTWKAPKK